MRTWAVLWCGLVLLGCGRNVSDDTCPDDPDKTSPGACGCGVSDADADGNGVPDCFDADLDLCPSDPHKTLPGMCGCGVSDADEDGDGIPDCLRPDLDLCPDDPDKTLPGVCGCGVPDTDVDDNQLPDCFASELDLCPDDPDKALPGVCGCGLSDVDADGSGIPDCLDSQLDLCPRDQTKTLPGVCGCGVSDADADGDGIPDCLGSQLDLCPDDPDKTLPGVCGCGVPDTDVDDNQLPDCLIAVGDGEPWNNEKTGAEPLTPGELVQAYVLYVGDEDWYRLDVEAGQTIQVLLDQDRTLVDPYLELQAPDGSRMWSVCVHHDQGATSIASGLRGALVSGTYYLLIDDCEGDDSSDTVPYRLRVEVADSPDPGEPDNDSAAGARVLQLDAPTEGYLGHYGDEDWFQLDVPANQAVRVTLTQPLAYLNPKIELWPPSQPDYLMWTDSAVGGTAPIALDSGVLTSAYVGSYLIRVSELDGTRYSETVPYTLTVAAVAP